MAGGGSRGAERGCPGTGGAPHRPSAAIPGPGAAPRQGSRLFPCLTVTFLFQCSRLLHRHHPPSKDMPSSLRRDPTSGPPGEQSSYRPTSLKWTFQKLTSITMNWISSQRNAQGELTGIASSFIGPDFCVGSLHANARL